MPPSNIPRSRRTQAVDERHGRHDGTKTKRGGGRSWEVRIRGTKSNVAPAGLTARSCSQHLARPPSDHLYRLPVPSPTSSYFSQPADMFSPRAHPLGLFSPRSTRLSRRTIPATPVSLTSFLNPPGTGATTAPRHGPSTSSLFSRFSPSAVPSQQIPQAQLPPTSTVSARK